MSDEGTRAQYCFPAVALELQQQQFALVGRCLTRSAVASGCCGQVGRRALNPEAMGKRPKNSSGKKKGSKPKASEVDSSS